VDKRVNTNYVLFSIHVIFHRFHNYLVDQILAIKPADETLNDDELFTIARNLNIAIYQHIVLNEYLEHLLGGLDEYNGPDDERKPGFYIETNSAGLRTKHSMLKERLVNLNPNNPRESRTLRAFNGGKFKTDPVWTEKMIRGSAMTSAKARGFGFADDIRDRIKTKNGVAFLIDVLALDIQRGRDHGIPTYAGMRDDFDLPEINDFSSFGDMADELTALYGTPANMDLIVGLLGEPSEDGGVLGEVGNQVIAVSFERVRETDHLWYQNTDIFPNSLINWIETKFIDDVIATVYNNGASDIEDGFIMQDDDE